MGPEQRHVLDWVRRRTRSSFNTPTTLRRI